MNRLLQGKKAIIYDMDNTLVARNAAFFKTLYLAMDAVKTEIYYDIPHHDRIVEVQKMNLPFEQIFPTLFPNPEGYQHTESLEKIILKKYRQIAESVPYESTPFGVETIAQFKQQDMVQIVVTNRVNMVDERLSQAGYPKFDLIYALPSKSEKPTAFQNLLTNLKTRNIGREQVLSVGDHVDDYLFSKQMGIEFAAILQGLNTKEEFLALGLDENHIFDNLGELMK